MSNGILISAGSKTEDITAYSEAICNIFDGAKANDIEQETIQIALKVLMKACTCENIDTRVSGCTFYADRVVKEEKMDKEKQEDKDEIV